MIVLGSKVSCFQHVMVWLIYALAYTPLMMILYFTCRVSLFDIEANSVKTFSVTDEIHVYCY